LQFNVINIKDQPFSFYTLCGSRCQNCQHYTGVRF